MQAGASRDNNFDLLRLFAATAVLVSHCYPLTASGEDPLARLTGHAAGELGVTIFFAISGYLVTLSWLADPNPRRFAARRGLRLLPALAVVAFLTAFMLGPALTTLGPGAYLADPGPYLYAVRTSLLVTVAGTLPGVFAGNPFPDAVNGSLWTLPVEALAYVMVLGAGLLGLLRRSRTVLLVAGVALLAFLSSGWSPLDLTAIVPAGAADAGIPSGLRLAAVFLGGTLVALHRERLPLSLPGVAVAFAVWWLLRDTGLEPLAAALTMPYAVVTLAFRRRVRVGLYERGGDASYGIYIYAFPVQQTVVHFIPDISPGALLALALPVTFVLGRLSWRLVEEPALRHKPRARAAPVVGHPSLSH
jgi:peptidoglycan/LPS O-acetylase OafA/YrhL